MFLDQEQNYIALGFQRQAEKGFADIQALATRVVNNRGTGCPGLSRRVHHGISFSILNEYNDHFKMHNFSSRCVLFFLLNVTFVIQFGLGG